MRNSLFTTALVLGVSFVGTQAMAGLKPLNPSHPVQEALGKTEVGSLEHSTLERNLNRTESEKYKKDFGGEPKMGEELASCAGFNCQPPEGR